MENILVGPGPPCFFCGLDYGEHDSDCPVKDAAEKEKSRRPRRFRVKCDKHPNGSDSKFEYGCYFPLTDLGVTDMGHRGTGEPKDVEWID